MYSVKLKYNYFFFFQQKFEIIDNEISGQLHLKCWYLTDVNNTGKADNLLADA